MLMPAKLRNAEPPVLEHWGRARAERLTPMTTLIADRCQNSGGSSKLYDPTDEAQSKTVMNPQANSASSLPLPNPRSTNGKHKDSKPWWEDLSWIPDGYSNYTDHISLED